MKKIVPFLFIAIIVVATNCRRDINVQTTVDETKDEIHFQDSVSAQSVITHLYEVQEGEKPSYKFVHGRSINPSEPNRYYIACNSADDAALFYNTYCTDEPIVFGYENVGDSLVLNLKARNRRSDFGSYGYTALNIGDGDPEYATIELSFKEVGDTHMLIFVPESYLPYNSDYAAFQSPYLLGDIYQDSFGAQWLCVKQSQPLEKGYFARLADDDERKWIRKIVFDNYKWPVIHYAVPLDGEVIAEKYVWENFFKIILYSQGRNALEAMKKNTNGVNMTGTRDLMLHMTGEKSYEKHVYQIGRADVTPRKYHAACCRYLHRVTIPFIHISGNSIFMGESNSWHEFDTQGGHISQSSLKEGTEMLQLTFEEQKLPNMQKIFPIQGGRN